MLLRDLICDFSYHVIKGSIDTNVTGFTSDSRKICPGYVFICIRGQEHDGHNNVKDALECQAAVLVTERLSASMLLKNNMAVILVSDTKKALAHISARFYQNSAQKMTIIGITGTKGKTTTAYFLKSILETAGYSCGIIGTNGWEVNGSCHNGTHTTPLSWQLHEILQEMYQQGCSHVIMEVSSIGMKDRRVYGILFTYGIFTNLYPDHIGGKEHKNMEEYRYWKQQFFTQCKVGIFNKDDENWKEMSRNIGNKMVTYSLKDKKCLIYGKNSCIYEEEGHLGSRLELVWNNTCQQIEIPVVGVGNQYNALAAAACACHMGISLDCVTKGIAQTVVKGRTELIYDKNGIRILIDYAHNGESLKQLLTALREYHPKRLICLFGCGGCRSMERRYAMGVASGTLADLTVLTEDNSREENPNGIIDAIVSGVASVNGAYVVILDRKKAITWTINQACQGDVIVLAGKGHEAYQEKDGVRIPFSEHEIVAKLWAEQR